jgi:uncharacterized protein DUF1707
VENVTPAGDLRVSDADRDRAISELSEHFQAGRLTADEFDERSGQALQARTGKELAVLFADLPGDRAAVTSPPPPGPAPAARIGMAAPVLVGVLVSLVVVSYSQHSLRSYPAFAAPGPNFHPLVPILVVLFVMWCLARRRHRRDRWEERGPRFDDHEDVQPAPRSRPSAQGQRAGRSRDDSDREVR